MSNLPKKLYKSKGAEMKRVIIKSTLLLFVLSIVVAAQPAEANRGMKEGFIKKLNLSPEQEKQIKEIRYEQQKKMIDLRSQVQKNQLELKNMISSNNIDEKKIIDLTNTNSNLQAEMKSNGIKSWLSIYKLLNTEQQEMWVKTFGNMGMRERIKDRMMDRMRDRRPQ